MPNSREFPVVFLLSTPRAGSTLLASMLGSHSLVHCPPEPWLLLPLTSIAPGQSIIFAAYDHALAQKAWADWYDEQNFSKASASFALSIYQSQLAKTDKQIFVDKTPRYYHILPWLDKIFPLAPKIWIKRSPLDVIASTRKVWGLSIDKILGVDPVPSSFDNTISHSLLISYFGRKQETQYIIRYEDLVASPRREIEQLCAFLKIEMEESMLDFSRNEKLMQSHSKSTMGDKNILGTTSVHAQSIGRWREALSRDDLRRILEVLSRDIFDQLGYADEYDEAVRLAGVDPRIGMTEKFTEISRAYAEYISMGKTDRDTLSAVDDLRIRLAESELARRQYKTTLEWVAASRVYKVLRRFGLWKWFKV
jgi:hypothetical protein